jgi:rRNA-processing protein FCF1
MDTNFIVMPAQFGIDIFTETENTLERSVDFVILSSVISEIETLAEKASRTEKIWFRIAMDLVEKCQVIDYSPSKSDLTVDDELLEYLEETGHILATNDKELKQRARKKGISVLMLRGKKKLMLEGQLP